MAKEPIVMRNAASDALARKNAANSMVLRGGEYNIDYPGLLALPVSPAPVITSGLTGSIGLSIAGTGVAGATLNVYRNAVPFTTLVVSVSGTWLVTASSAGSYTITQLAAGQTVSPLSAAVVIS
jgi:hypothetical protein